MSLTSTSADAVSKARRFGALADGLLLRRGGLNTIEAEATLENCRALINQIIAGLLIRPPLKWSDLRYVF
jgi:hypothetical protein